MWQVMHMFNLEHICWLATTRFIIMWAQLGIVPWASMLVVDKELAMGPKYRIHELHPLSILFLSCKVNKCLKKFLKRCSS